jgi:hypothetical protein
MKTRDKLQNPKPKLQINPKLQIPTGGQPRTGRFGVWILGLLWVLDFGFWIFSKNGH